MGNNFYSLFKIHFLWNSDIYNLDEAGGRYAK
jgi:hypothetical protein